MLNRGLILRRIMMQLTENDEKLNELRKRSVLTREFYQSEDDYIFYFIIDLVTQFCDTKVQTVAMSQSLDLL